MFRIARLFLSLGSAQVSEFRAQTGRRLVYGALLGFFGLILVVLGLAAITTLLAERFGLAEAFGMMAGGAALCALIVLSAAKLAERRHRALAAERAELQQKLSQLAMLTAFGSARPKTGHIVGLGIAAAAALLILGRLGGHRDKD
ncbi:MAG: hypothetical protein U1E34_13210 [Amaricoccus sp.]